MKTKLLIFSCLLSLSPALFAEISPANASASPQARAILDYLHGLGQKASQRVLLGRFLGYPDRNFIPENSLSLAPTEEIYQRTGRWPALVGADCSGRTVLDYTNHRDLSYEAVNPVLKAYAKAGGLVTICVHYPSAVPPYGLRDGGVDLRDLLKPGPACEMWLKQADYVAEALADLQSSDVVVMFRPLHELTSNGHWWTKGKATCRPTARNSTRGKTRRPHQGRHLQPPVHQSCVPLRMRFSPNSNCCGTAARALPSSSARLVAQSNKLWRANVWSNCSV
jgi:hypothetical protein